MVVHLDLAVLLVAIAFVAGFVVVVLADAFFDLSAVLGLVFLLGIFAP